MESESTTEYVEGITMRYVQLMQVAHKMYTALHANQTNTQPPCVECAMRDYERFING